MPVTRADLLAILHGITAEGHSRTVAVAVRHLVFGKALLDLCNHFRFWEKLVGTAFDIAFRELDGSLYRLFRCQLSPGHMGLSSIHLGASGHLLPVEWVTVRF